MALMAIMTLCLLVYAAVQWRIRQALQHSQQTYPDQKGKPNPRPTARRVFQSLIDISVLHVSSLTYPNNKQVPPLLPGQVKFRLEMNAVCPILEVDRSTCH
jgi:transposase